MTEAADQTAQGVASQPPEKPYEAFLNFALSSLVPCAHYILRTRYKAYGEGADIGIETKADKTPASCADRDTEAALRALIDARFPEHGIWGEEFGAEKLDAQWVWVLDPLDGTREFLARRPGCFGTLIGLLHRGVPVLGVIGDPLDGQIVHGVLPSAPLDSARTQAPETDAPAVDLSGCTLSCTAPDAMFKTPELCREAARIMHTARHAYTGLNCQGFAGVAQGRIDAAFEDSLSLHDIAALIPVLAASGAVVTDLCGTPYDGRRIDLRHAQTGRFGIIAARTPALSSALQAQLCLPGMPESVQAGQGETRTERDL